MKPAKLKTQSSRTRVSSFLPPRAPGHVAAGVGPNFGFMCWRKVFRQSANKAINKDEMSASTIIGIRLATIMAQPYT
jgi:hypothetical protein